MLFCYILDKDEKQAPRRFRIIVGHMVMFQGDPKALGQWPQTMPFKIWIEVAGKFQGIDDRLGDLGKTMTLVVDIHEAHVKSGIVGNQNRILAEFLKLLQDLHQGFGPTDMLVGDPCQLGRIGRQRMPRIDKLIKLLNDIALVHLRSGDLDQVIVNG